MREQRQQGPVSLKSEDSPRCVRQTSIEQKGRNGSMNMAQAIGKVLKDSGVTFLFGIPGGGSSVDLINAAEDEGIRFVLTQHESSAAIMASVLGDVTGVPGVCVSTLGPGALNLCNGMAHATLDRSPVVAFTDRYSSELVDLAYRQKVYHTDLFKPFTKLSVGLTKTNWSEVVARGLRVAAEPKKGAVHIDFPNDLSRAEVAGPGTAVAGPEFRPEGGPAAAALSALVRMTSKIPTARIM